MIENANREEINQIGKNALIHRLSEYFTLDNASSKLGIDEDAAVLNFDVENTIFSSQLFVENIHFDLTYCPLKHLGYKVVTASVMDIVAMNALPSQIRINLAVSNRFSVEAIEEFITGAAICCKNYKIDLVGLDVTSSVSGFTIATSSVGHVLSEKVIVRNQAKENELICVSGDLGSAYAGLIILEREKKVFQANPTAQPDLVGYDYLLERQLKPDPRIHIITEMAKQDILPTSMIHLKDGLSSALIHLCSASKTGCLVFEEKLPIDPLTFSTLKDLKIVATTVALNGGNDYELLFTIKQSDYEKIKKVEDVSVIGYMTTSSSGHFIITNDNKQIELKAQEYYAEAKSE